MPRPADRTSKPCPACGQASWSEIDPGDVSFGLFECIGCHTLRMEIARPEPVALYETYYSGDAVGRLAGPLDALWRAFRRRKAVSILGSTSPRPARILDIGCERGELLDALRGLGAVVSGTQISHSAAEYARRRFGIDVFLGELGDAPFASGSFDAALMINVLEHLPDPGAYVALVARVLPPGGVFWIELPNVRSFTALVARKRWLHADPIHHFWGFSPQGLTELLERHGLYVERTIHLSLEHGPIGVVQSLLNFLPGRRNVIFGLISEGMPHGTARLVQLALHVVLGALLLPPSIVIAGCEALLGHGQVITVIARRR